MGARAAGPLWAGVQFIQQGVDELRLQPIHNGKFLDLHRHNTGDDARYTNHALFT